MTVIENAHLYGGPPVKHHVLGLGITLAAAAGCSGPLQPRDAERPLFSQSVSTGYSGAICTSTTSDCNRCVPNVATAFNSLPTNLTPAAFHFGTTFRWMNDPSNLHHNEGIVRLAHAGGTHFAVSRYTSESAEIAFVNFASRAAFGAGRLYGNYTGDNRYYPTNDVAEGSIVYPLYRHAGGMQALGMVVAVGMETEVMSGIPKSKVVFVNAFNPGSPGWIPAEVSRWTESAGNVGMVRLGDGTYLLMVGNYNSRQLTFYQSTGTDIFNPGVFDSVATIANPYPQNWQSSQIVTQCDGALFAVVSGTGGTIEGHVRLVRIDPYLGYFSGIAYKTLVPSHSYGELGAGAGAYVDPDGKLFYYVVPPDNEIAELNHNNGVCPQNKTQGVAMFEY